MTGFLDIEAAKARATDAPRRPQRTKLAAGEARLIDIIADHQDERRAKGAWACPPHVEQKERTDPEEESLAERLQRVARRRNMTQAILAHAADIGPARVHDYWNGHRQPDSVTLFALARTLDVSAEWLATGEPKWGEFVTEAQRQRMSDALTTHKARPRSSGPVVARRLVEKPGEGSQLIGVLAVFLAAVAAGFVFQKRDGGSRRGLNILPRRANEINEG